MLKRPLKAPSLGELLSDYENMPRLSRAAAGKKLVPLVSGEYVHWDKLSRLSPPEGFTNRIWWLSLKLARGSLLSPIPLQDLHGNPFEYAVFDQISESLHEIDLGAGGRIAIPEPITNPETRSRYFVNSLIEEAITSSQLEGAGTTRIVAKDMLRTQRPPRDRGERMILNNYVTMERINALRHEALTPQLVMDIHRCVTEGTLDDPIAAGRLRRPDEDIVVGDLEGGILHRPPSANELPGRLAEMCRFANGETPDHFVHPAIRSILLHFWLAYDHPFVDGNGRTARALFYWSMLHHGYWAFEFISISTIIRKAKGQYLQAFLQTETDENDLTYFVVYHLRIIDMAIRSLKAYLKRKADSMQQLSANLQGLSALNHRQKALIAHALRHPGYEYSIDRHQHSHGIVYQTARTDLLDLASRGLLTSSRVGRSYRFYPAGDLEDLLQHVRR